MAHAKTWIVEPDPRTGNPGATLIGSANLTKKGLLENFEMLALVDSKEHGRLRSEMRQLMSKSWLIEDRLLKLLQHRELQQQTNKTITTTSPWRDLRASGLRDHKSETSSSTRENAEHHGKLPTSQPPTQDSPRRPVPPNYPRARPTSPFPPTNPRYRQRRRISGVSRLKQLAGAAGMVAAGIVLLFALPFLLDLISGSSNSENGSGAGANLSAPIPDRPMTEAPTPAPPLTDELATASSLDQSAPEDSLPAPGVPATLMDRPEIETSAPPEDWAPAVGGNASSYGEPQQPGLQWIAWQPTCPDCEPGATLTWVGSYAFSFNQGVGITGLLRPLLRSAGLHRERTGPQIDWQRDVGNSSGEDTSHLMVPEPGPFLELLVDAKQIRFLTAEGLDATFTVEGFLSTPAQANLDHCGHYP